MTHTNARSIGSEAAIYSCAYLLLSALLVFINSEAVPDREFPWTWYWIIWSVLLAPTPVVTVFAAATVDPPRRRLLALYAGSMTITMAGLESLFLLDAHFYAVVAVVLSLSGVIWLVFKLGSPRETGGPTTLKS